MTEPPAPEPGQLARELAYYRRECNDLGARLLRLQEEQSQAFREARRSRTVARLIREAYRLVDAWATPAAIGGPMLEIIVENALCDRAALLQRTTSNGTGGERFLVTHALGLGAVPDTEVRLPVAPGFFFTTSRTPFEPPAYELAAILGVPYVLWAHDPASGFALILGNQSEGNVSRPFEAADQELIEGALSVTIDVLRRKEAEVALRQAMAAAEEASAVRARFLATLSHELRTPLNAVIGFSEMIAPSDRPEPAPELRRRYAMQILESGRSLLELINNILDYSSLAQATPYLDCAWQPAAPILDSVVREVLPTASRLDVVVERLHAAPIELLVDRVRLRQVASNLIGNALKFTPRGGAVRVAIHQDGDGAAVLEIVDNGIGIAPADIPRALEPFQQIESGHARGFAGAGLGLAIAKGLTEAHGGKLLIESAPGFGTTVRVLLPAARVRPLQAEMID